jgi:hypothetical protein
MIAGLAVATAAWRVEAPRRVLYATASLLFVFLPWLPLPVPLVFLVWTGAFASLPWIATAIAVAALMVPPNRASGWRVLAPERSTPLLPGVLSAVCFSLAAWGVSPSIPGGDEPHYLVITQSLLRDGDLRIENNHQRGDYRDYFAGDLAPHSIRRGRNGEVYSIHAPGIPALVAPAFAVAGYRGVVAFLILVSSAGCALAWWLAWRVTGNHAAAWFGWAAVTLAAPFALEAFTVFPDGPGAIVVLTGFWALLRADTGGEKDDRWLPWMLHGVALALLPWMHTRFAVIAGTLGGLVLVRVARAPNPLGKAVAFLAAPAISALAWLFFFTIVYGAPDPSAPYGRDTQNSLAYLPNGLGGLLFDQGFGLLATAPVLAIALAGFARTRRLAIEWLVVAVPYLIAVATYAMWWAGMSGPARFLVPLVLPLAIPAACAWVAVRSRGARAVMLAALVASAWLSVVMASGAGGRLAYHQRNEGGLTAAPYLEWANHAVDLPAAFPAFVPQPVQPDPGGLVSRATAVRAGAIATLPWLLSFGAAAAFVAWRLRRRASASTEEAIATVAMATGTAITIAVAAVWGIQRAAAVTATPAQLDVLRRVAAGRVVAVSLDPLRRMSRGEAWSMRMEIPIRRARTVRSNAPLAAFPAVPAGSYVITAKRRGGEGWLMIGVGNDQFAIATEPIGVYDAGLRVDLPVDVRALLVRADEGARAQLESIELRPLAPPASRLSNDVARRAVRYDGGLAFFFDDRAFPEPSGFWVAGGRETRVAVRADTAPLPSLLLKNGGAANTVTLESGEWRQQIALASGEERRIDVPTRTPGVALVRIRSAGGFRPSEQNPGSRDTRHLGVFVRLVGP